MQNYIFPTKPKSHPEAIVSDPQYRFTILTDRLLRYEWSDDGQFEDQASTFAINRELTVPQFDVIEAEDSLQIITSHLHLTYDKLRFSTSGLSVTINAKISEWGSSWRFGCASEANLGGTARTLDTVDGRCDMGHGVLSKDGIASIDDSSSMLFDGQGFVAPRKPGHRIDGYLFCYGRDYKAAIKALYTVSGKQPVLPRWALGNWWSRYFKYTQDEYIALMDAFREHDIPLSVAVVDIDWHLVEDERVPHAGWTGYTWDEKLFPDPVAFGKELHKRKLKITLNDHPHAGIHSHEDAYEEMAAALGHDTSKEAPILFDPTNPRFMHAYLNILHRKIEEVACDFWWVDWQQGPYSKIPGLDPLWLLNHFHFLDHGRNGDKAIIFSRYGGPGSHRYPVGFSGDTVTTWASLEFQPEFTATASNIGYGWWSHDIGGHMLGSRDDERMTRWVQLGVFSPIMRLHSTNSQWNSKEPWLHRKESEDIMTSFLRLRHRMVPYLYTHNVIGSREDEPLVQPMYWSYPERAEAYSVPNQYYFGSELIVAPIVKPRDPRTALAKVQAWLPPQGHHVDILTGTVYDGDRTLNLYRPLEQIPVLAREGSIIPLDASKAPENDCSSPEGFEILVVIGRDTKAQIIEESSKSQSSPVDQVRSRISYQQTAGKLSVNGTGQRWIFRFLGINTIPKNLAVCVDGVNITRKTVLELQQSPSSLVVQLPGSATPDATTQYNISVLLGDDPQLAVLDQKHRIWKILLDYQTDLSVKDNIWRVVDDNDKRLHAKIGDLISLELDEALIGPIVELMFADGREISSV